MKYSKELNQFTKDLDLDLLGVIAAPADSFDMFEKAPKS